MFGCLFVYIYPAMHTYDTVIDLNDIFILTFNCNN